MEKTIITEGRVMNEGIVKKRRRCKIRTGKIIVMKGREVRIV
jgi:ribosome-associated protein YbcJ (S4-like RNA binding protein)